MKDTWRIINTINVSPRNSLPPLFSTCAGDVSDPIATANEFNHIYYFSNVGSTFSSRIGKFMSVYLIVYRQAMLIQHFLKVQIIKRSWELSKYLKTL